MVVKKKSGRPSLTRCRHRRAVVIVREQRIDLRHLGDTHSSFATVPVRPHFEQISPFGLATEHVIFGVVWVCDVFIVTSSAKNASTNWDQLPF